MTRTGPDTITTRAIVWNRSTEMELPPYTLKDDDFESPYFKQWLELVLIGKSKGWSVTIEQTTQTTYSLSEDN